MNQRTALLVAVILVCAAVFLGVHWYRGRAAVADEPLQLLRESVSRAAIPIDAFAAWPPDVQARYLVYLSEQTVTQREAELISAVIHRVDALPEALPISRVAIATAQQRLVATTQASTQAATLRSAVVYAGKHKVARMQLTFLSCLEQYTILLKEPDIRAAVEELARSGQTEFDIGKKASALLEKHP